MSILAPLQKCLLMRNGSEIWIPREKAETLENACISGTAPRWVKLTDADGRTINTADISEFLTPEQADERHRLKLGEWKCQYNHWHGRRDNCDCRRRIAQEKYENESRRRMEEASRPLTPEQIEKNKAKLAEMKRNLSKIFEMPKATPVENLKALEAREIAARRGCQKPPADPPEPRTAPPTAAQLAQDEAVREFDKQYLGETDEIDVSKIPF